MEIYLLNTAEGLKPLYESDRLSKSTLKIGKVYKADIVHPRNIDFHRKFFALLNVGYANTKMEDRITKEPPSFDQYRKYVTMKVGYANVFHTDKGMMCEAQSISFSKMDEEAFQDLYKKVLQFIINDTGATEEFIEKELLSFL